MALEKARNITRSVVETIAGVRLIRRPTRVDAEVTEEVEMAAAE